MWEKDGVIYPVITKLVLTEHTIYNPSNEQILAAGYKHFEPQPPPPPEPIPQKYSKYKIIKTLGEDWPTYKAQIEAAGLYDLFINAEYLEEGDPLFDSFLENIPDEVKEKLSECLWD